MERYRGPDFDEMMPQVFAAIKALGGSGTVEEINRRTLDLLALPEEIRQYPHGDSDKSEVEYRLAWTRTYMKKLGILENSERGVWALTPKGQALETVDYKFVVNEVRRLSCLTLSHVIPVNVGADEPVADGVDVPDEIQSWRDKLRNVLYNLPPAAFERLTQRLLRESGFTQVEVTGRTGDGGIDGTGIIKLNGIVSFHMLFQCKRYRGAVSAREMRDFRGAMQGRADKGLFITTGRFTAAAVYEANRVGTAAIDLIDGDELIDRLRELKLGVQPVLDYQIDEGWFAAI